MTASVGRRRGRARSRAGLTPGQSMDQALERPGLSPALAGAEGVPDLVLERRERSKPLAIAILGPTAAGKSALALALAERFDGEIVNCDSTAVYRGFDIGTDKVAVEQRRGIPHHLIDVADPTEVYTAARYGRDAAAAVRSILARGRLPLIVGGTGFYYRALTRGLFPGPGADHELRERLSAMAARRGHEFLHRMLRRWDPESAARIAPGDVKRVVRALEVYLLTGRPLTAHFVDTQAPLAFCEVLPIALRIPAALTAARVSRRVDEQFARGLMDEVRGLLACGVPETARPFGGLVYRQAVELLHGMRGEVETRALIAQENRRYARRQLIWFRKEPNLAWLDGPGEAPEVIARVERALTPLHLRDR
jgi:tRNA dimethylallyltransferase